MGEGHPGAGTGAGGAHPGPSTEALCSLSIPVPGNKGERAGQQGEGRNSESDKGEEGPALGSQHAAGRWAAAQCPVGAGVVQPHTASLLSRALGPQWACFLLCSFSVGGGGGGSEGRQPPPGDQAQQGAAGGTEGLELNDGRAGSSGARQAERGGWRVPGRAVCLHTGWTTGTPPSLPSSLFLPPSLSLPPFLPVPPSHLLPWYQASGRTKSGKKCQRDITHEMT